jgi:hypothetical protein
MKAIFLAQEVKENINRAATTLKRKRFAEELMLASLMLNPFMGLEKSNSNIQVLKRIENAKYL